jgi:MFS family permease
LWSASPPTADGHQLHLLVTESANPDTILLPQLTIPLAVYYGTQYFKNSGINQPFTIQIITSCINTATTVPGLYAVDKFGRRPLLLWGAVGMCVSQFLVAMLGTLTTGQNPDGSIIVYNVAAQKAGIAFVCIYIVSQLRPVSPEQAMSRQANERNQAFFASTWGPLAWVVTGEIFPLKTRAKALSMTTATNVSSCCIHCAIYHTDRAPVAPQLGHRLRHTLPRQLRPRLRQPTIQDLLYLVRLLLFVYCLRL